MYSIHRWCRIDRNGCVNCGGRSFEQAQVIPNELARTWELSHRERVWFDEREGHFCQNCRMSKRVRMLLWSVRKIYGELKSLNVLHLNQINDLNQALSRARQLVETAYYPEKELGAAINGFSNQDMTHLTFSNNCFDLVIHSETLEHLHDYEDALIEAKRVLKPGGYQVYSVPLLHDRQTRRRITKDTVGNFIPLLPLSTHGLEGEYPVVWEFGGDFIKQRREQILEIDYDNYWKNKTVFTIVERKEQ